MIYAGIAIGLAVGLIAGWMIGKMVESKRGRMAAEEVQEELNKLQTDMVEKVESFTTQQK